MFLANPLLADNSSCEYKALERLIRVVHVDPDIPSIRSLASNLGAANIEFSGDLRALTMQHALGIYPAIPRRLLKVDAEMVSARDMVEPSARQTETVCILIRD